MLTGNRREHTLGVPVYKINRYNEHLALFKIIVQDSNGFVRVHEARAKEVSQLLPGYAQKQLLETDVAYYHTDTTQTTVKFLGFKS